MPFEHEIIDLKKKPKEFLELSPTGLVPLLQLPFTPGSIEALDASRAPDD